ncbi:hypothetical protein F5144DRAFT_370679 [Chaetomium tenue]|uniref:Uncharacterized protein n=1 Tax=Chaetomium tenue TaxID=1854479 RepID=A0ACB7NZN9_9PEZI|nr:hypothetical protein F5144DRAFT_370679 [Chaetomium globosum]
MSHTEYPIAIIDTRRHICAALRYCLLPDFDVVYTALNAADAASELPKICAGKFDDTPPKCPLGSNQDRELKDKRAPRIIIFFPLISPEDVDVVLGKVLGEPDVEVQPLILMEGDLEGCRETDLAGLADVVRRVVRRTIPME